MLSEFRTGIIAAFVIFFSLLSFTAHAQIKKLDEDYGYRSYRFGTDQSQFAAILEQPDESGNYKVKLSIANELREVFGDSVRNVYFKFNEEHKLKEIKIFYPNVDKEMDKDATNIFLSRIPSNIIPIYGKNTSQRGLYPNMEMTWGGKKVSLYYTMTRTMGIWQRSVSIWMIK